MNKSEQWRCNCVKYARSMVPKLPYGLFTLNNKKCVINACNPKVGSVAIMNIGLPWGHVGVVEYVGKHHITIREANFQSCAITERHNTEEELRIIGYFQP